MLVARVGISCQIFVSAARSGVLFQRLVFVACFEFLCWYFVLFYHLGGSSCWLFVPVARSCDSFGGLILQLVGLGASCW